MNKLEVSYTRAFIRLFVTLALGIALFVVVERIRGNHWDFSYLGLNIITAPFAALFCLFFVPRQIEWSDVEFRIQTRFGKLEVIPWSQLEAYGRGRSVFLLQFAGHGTFQIFPSAFDSEKWRQFKRFLASNHPDKLTRFWFGSRAVGV